MQKRMQALLTSQENRLFARLTTPQKIQQYLDTLSINFETAGETYMSPRRVMREKRAHCFEGALFAAAALFYHGLKPLLLDFQTLPSDEDHVVALFRQHGRWGAISKTNHTILRYRDPVYETVRELAMSYFHEYFLSGGRKSMVAYSAPFDVSKHKLKRWLTVEEDLDWLVEALDKSRHFPIAPKKNMRMLRNVTPVELEILSITEWSKKRRQKRSYGK